MSELESPVAVLENEREVPDLPSQETRRAPVFLLLQPRVWISPFGRTSPYGRRADRSRAGSSGSDAIDSASGDEETNGQTGHNEELKTHSPPATVENDSEDVETQDRNEKQNSVEASVSVQNSDTDILERSELDSIETKHGLSTGAPERSVPKSPQWSKEEHARFLEAMHFYHRDWRRISLHVRSKTVSESRMHASK